MKLAAIEYGAEGWKDFQNNDVNRCKTGYLTDVFPKTGLVLDDVPMASCWGGARVVFGDHCR